MTGPDTSIGTGRWPPRIVVAGLGGDSGKTLVALGLIHAARKRGLETAAFKKGPDYIDAAWLRWASGRPARNLDTYLMGGPRVQDSFGLHASKVDLAVIEGNRGLYDGVDANGTHSTAALAKLLRAPVLLVVNAAKVTRTLAACVLGCQHLDPEVMIAGVVLNRVAGSRHERVATEAIESVCGVPILGVVPRIAGDSLIPGRHLGLVTPEEHGSLADIEPRIAGIGEANLNVTRILEIANRAETRGAPASRVSHGSGGAGLRIGYLRDSAFTFYYPENLEALESAGAELVAISSVESPRLPPGLHALYIGGGFPETHAPRIAANRSLLAEIRGRAERGLPIYAECGGLMLLSRSLRQNGGVTEMAGVLPCDVELCRSPQGHGYTELLVESPNAFFTPGLVVRGHEFHYSRVVQAAEGLLTSCAVRRGSGSVASRDGIVVNNVWAAFTHLHAAATPEWAAGLIAAARSHAAKVNA